MQKYAVRSPPRAREPPKTSESSEDSLEENSDQNNSSDEEVKIFSPILKKSKIPSFLKKKIALQRLSN